MAEKPVKYFKRSDVKNSADSKSTHIIIHNSVYDVTDFLNEHPGGEEVLLEQAGKDGTEAFEDVGHSKDARDMMSKYKIGELCEEEQVKTTEKVLKDWSEKKSDEHGDSTDVWAIVQRYLEGAHSSWKSWMIPVTLAVLATIIYRFYFHCH